MSQAVDQTNRLFCTLSGGLFSVLLVAGAVQSLRVERRLPAIDLFVSGSTTYVSRLVAQKEDTQAIKQLKLQAKLLPYDAPTYEYLGNLLMAQKLPREARAQFQKLVRLRPTDAKVYNHLGNTYLDTGHPDLAAPLFAHAIELNPDFALAHNSRGVALAQLGKISEAEKCFAKAVVLSPDYDDAKVNLDRARQELRRDPQK